MCRNVDIREMNVWTCNSQGQSYDAVLDECAYIPSSDEGEPQTLALPLPQFAAKSAERSASQPATTTQE